MTQLWLLAFSGAVLGVAGDVLCVTAARRGSYKEVVVAAVLFAACAPIWYAMSRSVRGVFAAPAVAWSTTAAVLSLAVVRVLDGAQTPRQWIGLILVLTGALVRG